MADPEKQTPVLQSLCGSLRRDGHWKCLSLTLMIIGCLTAISWCHLTVTEKTAPAFLEVYGRSERSGPCKDGYIYIPVACVVMLYLVYLVECWHSHTRLELRYKCDVDTVYSAVQKMQTALPVIWWKATCYHYVRRTRQVMRYRNGDAFTSTQVYYERVDSSTAGAAFNFTQCGVKDISRPLSDLEMYTAVKIKISKGFSFANVDTEYQFEDQRSRFFQEHETKDDYTEGREGMDLMNVDFKEYMIAFRDPNNLPWYISHAAFWLASVFLLSWPLRTLIELQTAHLNYHVHKLFGSNCQEVEGYTGVISRVSTMNSSEFEMSIRNNNVIVPSYSEAMLSDVHDQLQHRQYGTIKACPAKMPRSLTNVTLAARTYKRPVTPTITMNCVKKFKSCSAFGISEPMEPPGGAGSVRQQLQQLWRDRGRLQQRRVAASQVSMSALPSGNGNVRFHVGTPGTPEDLVMAPSFSCHSVTSSRTNDTLSDGTSANVDACRSALLIEGGQNVNQIRPGQVATNHTPPLTVICAPPSMSGVKDLGLRSSQVLANQTPPLTVICAPTSMSAVKDLGLRSSQVPTNQTPPLTAICAPSSVSAVKDLDQCPVDRSLSAVETGLMQTSARDDAVLGQTGTCHVFSLLPLTDHSSGFSGTTSTPATPFTPSSPPGYEEAIMMRQITSALVTQSSTPDKPTTGIELIRSVPPRRALRNTLATRSGGGRDETHNNDSILITPPAEAGIDRGLFPRSTIPSVEPSCLPDGRSTEGHQYYSHQHHPTISLQQQHHPPQQPVLKVLPKVSPRICHASDDSDAECLHGTSSDNKPGKSGKTGHKCLPNRTSKRGLVRDGWRPVSGGTWSGRDGAGDLVHIRSTTMDDRATTITPSSCGATTTTIMSPPFQSANSQERHHETSV